MEKLLKQLHDHITKYNIKNMMEYVWKDRTNFEKRKQRWNIPSKWDIRLIIEWLENKNDDSFSLAQKFSKLVK